MRHPHWPALDGLRGLALLAVFLHHVDASPGGFLGVSLFFTLSGFLITTLLLDDRASHGTIRLRRFWGRRLRRLVPAALVTIGAVLVIEQWASGGAIASTVSDDLTAATAWIANWRFALGEVSYANQFSDPSPVLHFWSLAIEEQFYVVFPLVCAVVLRRRIGFAFAVVVGIAASTAWSIALVGRSGFDRAYFDTGARAAELLVGVLAAVVVATWVPSDQAVRRLDRLSILAGLALLTSWFTVGLDATWLLRGGFAVHAVLSAIVVVAVRHRETTAARALAWRPLRAVGLASYGAYLFHWPVIQYLDERVLGVGGAALAAVQGIVTAALAGLSYHWFEQPIRRLHLPAIGPFPVAATALAAVVLVAVGANLDADEIRPRTGVADEFAGLPTTPPTVEVRTAPSTSPETVETPATTAPPGRPPVFTSGEEWSAPQIEGVPTVAVIGDSVVFNLGEALARWAEQTGSLAIYQRSYPGCTVLDIAPIFQPWDPDNPLETACFTYDQLIGEFRDKGVDTVLIGSSGMDALPRQHEGDWTEVGMADAFDQRLRDEYERLIGSLQGAGFSVVWMNQPCNRDPKPVARLDGRSLAQYLVQEIQSPVLDAHPEIPVIDVDAVICPDGRFSSTVGGVADARPDGGHINEPASDYVADQVIAPALLLLLLG